MPIKKSELYSHLWKSCDALRGGMDASQYKDYILVLLFVKYVSDKYAGKPDTPIIVPEGGSFKDMVALKGKPNIGEGIDKIIARLAEPNDLKGVIDVAYFNDSDKLGKGKDMVDRLSELISIFENPELDFTQNRAEGDDLLGDAYEYLMRNFATESGKSKGQFYTPAEVSRIMAQVIGINQAKRRDQTVYDPTCGSGSLLLKAAAETEHGISIYGQENDVATRGLAKMNMILHNNATADIRQGNTLSNPLFLEKDGALKTFDFAVSNPPFSTKSWSHGVDPENDPYKRFELGVPPEKNGDYAFLLHLITSLKSTGKGAIILPHGVLFRGNAEASIRKALIERGYIKGIIGLPPNLFYGTGIPACIIVIDKENANTRKTIFLIDASKGYFKDGNKNRLRSQDIHKIVDTFNNQLENPKYSRLVQLSEISDPKNDYNLNIPRYIDSQEDEDIQDIEAHLKGGIPQRDIEALSKYWQVWTTLKDELFVETQRVGYYNLKVDTTEIKTKIFENPQFKAYSNRTTEKFEKWKNTISPSLYNLQVGSKPKELISTISENLLSTFCDDHLIDKYDIYQHLMDYWAETMQDDTYLIATNGWKVQVNPIKNKKGKTTNWECDLIPKDVVIDKYFPKEKQSLEKLREQAENLTQQIQTLEEEHSGEDDPFTDLKDDKEKIIKTAIPKRIQELKTNHDSTDEIQILQKYMELTEQETKNNQEIKNAEKNLEQKLLLKYSNLTEKEIQALVIEEKWLKTIYKCVKNELESVTQKLVRRIKELSERYKTPLPKIEQDVEDFSKKVDKHLENMGFKW